MTAVLDVRPDGFVEAATFLGGNVADGVEAAWSSLLYGLKANQGMAGTDDVGSAWGASYDDAALVARRATQDLTNACRRLAALVAQTGINYAGAEAWSTPGGEPADSAAHQSVRNWQYDRALADAPTAIGVAMPAPKVWSVVAHAVGRLWPDGHQDDLHAAAHAWRSAADEVLALAPVLGSAARLMLLQVSPEAGDAFVAIDALIPHLHTLASAYRRIAQSCDDYAGHLDAAHSAILAELKSFVEWTAGIQITAGLLAAITFGGSEVVGQAGEAVEIARAAKVIKKIIDTLEAVMTAVRAEITRIGTELLTLPERLAPMLRIQVAEARFARALRVEMTAKDLRLANPRLVPPVAAPTGPARAIANLERSETEIAGFAKKEPAVPPEAENARLRNVIKNIYKGTHNSERVGDGTTGDAVRNERRTGEPTGGRFHSTKARESINALKKILRIPTLCQSDRDVAQALINDLKDALGGK